MASQSSDMVLFNCASYPRCPPLLLFPFVSLLHHLTPLNISEISCFQQITPWKLDVHVK